MSWAVSVSCIDCNIDELYKTAYKDVTADMFRRFIHLDGDDIFGRSFRGHDKAKAYMLDWYHWFLQQELDHLCCDGDAEKLLKHGKVYCRFYNNGEGRAEITHKYKDQRSSGEHFVHIKIRLANTSRAEYNREFDEMWEESQYSAVCDADFDRYWTYDSIPDELMPEYVNYPKTDTKKKKTNKS